MPEALIFGERERVLAAMLKERRERTIQNIRKGIRARRKRRYAEIRELKARGVLADRCIECRAYPWEHAPWGCGNPKCERGSAFYVNQLYRDLPAWMPQGLKRRNEIVRAALEAK